MIRDKAFCVETSVFRCAAKATIFFKMLALQNIAFCLSSQQEHRLVTGFAQEFAKIENVQTKRENGFQQLKSALPPKERRGFVLIDPPYELKEDYELVVKAIEEGYKRFATGVYAIWYPVVLRQHTKRIVRGLQETGIRKILQIELAVRPDSDQRGMTASGMIVINPPWQLESQMKKILPYLTDVLVPEGTGSWTVDWITPE